MGKFTVLTLAVLFAIGSTIFMLMAQATDVAHPMVGEKAPSIALEGHCVQLGDQEMELGEVIQGRLAIILFWSEHCLECQSIITFLGEPKDAYGDKLALVGINTDCEHQKEERDEASWAELLSYEAEGFDRSYLDSEKKALSIYKVNEIPTTFVVGSSGRISFVVEGHPPDYRDVLNGEIDGLVVGGE